jgi:hypothetical protein
MLSAWEQQGKSSLAASNQLPFNGNPLKIYIYTMCNNKGNLQAKYNESQILYIIDHEKVGFYYSVLSCMNMLNLQVKNRS